MSVIASTLIQGNQPLFNECERYLADKKYDGNTLLCFRTERKKRGLTRKDLDSHEMKKEYFTWQNADGSENGFELNGNALNISLLIVTGFLVYTLYFRK